MIPHKHPKEMNQKEITDLIQLGLNEIKEWEQFIKFLKKYLK
jgi:ABC-type amino acid transport substrate-binding protein